MHVSSEVLLATPDVHTLRHSVAVAWLESGVDIRAVADPLLGHSSVAVTGNVTPVTTPHGPL